MGTRNLTCVVVDGEIKVAQYCQWDGYPTGQGKTIYEFCRGLVDGKFEAFKARVRALREATREEVHAKWMECGADGSDWVGLDVSARMKERYPHFDRDMGAGILEAVASGSVTEVSLQAKFAADSLFCEWAYVVDLDAGVLEVYRGFQKEPHERGRFAKLPIKDDERRKKREVYYPVAEVARFKLDDLPSFDAFVEAVTPNDEEEGE